MIFVVAISCFIGVFLLSSEVSIHLKNTIQTIVINQNLSNFIVELLRLFLSLIAALSVTIISIKINFVNKQVFMEKMASDNGKKVLARKREKEKKKISVSSETRHKK